MENTCLKLLLHKQVYIAGGQKRYTCIVLPHHKLDFILLMSSLVVECSLHISTLLTCVLLRNQTCTKPVALSRYFGSFMLSSTTYIGFTLGLHEKTPPLKIF